MMKLSANLKSTESQLCPLVASAKQQQNQSPSLSNNNLDKHLLFTGQYELTPIVIKYLMVSSLSKNNGTSTWKCSLEVVHSRCNHQPILHQEHHQSLDEKTIESKNTSDHIERNLLIDLFKLPRKPCSKIFSIKCLQSP